MTEALSLIDLTPGEIERLPASLRRRIGGSSRPEDSPPGAWLLVGERTEGQVELLERALEMLPSLAAERGSRLSETNIEKILDVILSDAPRPRVENELEIDNARLRSRYIQETPLLTGAEVRAASGLNPRNKSEPASRWKREGKLFAVRRSGIDHYPAFQFADGSPRPVIKAILAALPKDMTGWQIAMWFASGNGWLDGEEPQERLSEPDAVVEAARSLADPAVG
ncbi:MAG: hypothetical protein OXE44_01745 [Nitrospinae bacterium]|nr:hypothetical protein [Nitrospinota bacterium]